MKNAKDELMKVFAALPQKDQQAIRECWENLSHGQPEIEVLSKDVLHKRGVRWAATNGAEYYFREELFSDSEPIPKSILEGAIAHELAHSFYAVEERNARLKRDIKEMLARPWQGIETPERKAIRNVEEFWNQHLAADFSEGNAWFKAKSWGFNQEETLAWLQKNLP